MTFSSVQRHLQPPRSSCGLDLSAKSQDPGMGTPVTANLFVPDDRDNMK